ncbi:MAG: hypothetical protein MJZ42_00245 [Bacteroidales bacterium]|nr:hypothetical protein [Bacteroidales bacterium]
MAQINKPTVPQFNNVTACRIIALLLLFVATSGRLTAQTYNVSHIGHAINTKGSESGAIVLPDSTILYASVQNPQELGNFLSIDAVLQQIYQAKLDKNGRPQEGTPCNWGMNSLTKNTYNIAYDDQNDMLYFTYCSPDAEQLSCDLYSMQRQNGTWKHPKRLPGSINLKGCTNTHPAVGHLHDGTTILYFTSNRSGGLGGYDIWYTLYSNGQYSTPANLGAPVNTRDDEITPFYHDDSQTLYFSSNKDGGHGNFDVYCSNGQRDQYATPVNLGPTLNSPQNDNYFTVSPLDPNTGFLASNRSESYFVKDSFCCNDIYIWHRTFDKPTPQKTEIVKQEKPVQPVNITPNQQPIRSLFPIKLYFHNDQPDPHSDNAASKTTYFQTYNRYMFLRDKYKEAYSNIPDSLQRDSIYKALDYFFDHEIKNNCDRFEAFIDMLAEDLRAGHTVCLTVKGYASPLHSAAYNDALSKRRISTIVNQIREWRNGRLKPYLDRGALKIKQLPYGSSQALSNVSADPRDPNSVYSPEAAMERRIEILDYSYED